MADLVGHPCGNYRLARLSAADVLPYLQHVASTLQYAHEHKLIHCDVKPENLV